MGWNTRTNLRSVETITGLVVEICYQMEGWRRLLRHLDRIERERELAKLSVFPGPRGREAAEPPRPGRPRVAPFTARG